MKWNKPDGIKSWFIALSCCYINCIVSGLGRLSGVLFVASVPRYNVGRTQASFPYTLASSIRNLLGPLAGYLGYKFGVRAISSIGALVGALGVGLCYFAEDIVVVTILWGVVFGIGFCFGNILLAITINQYFDKYRATASGISYTGSSIGSFILPPVVEILLQKCGLSQTFLVLSAFLLTCVPAALLLRTPNFESESKHFQEEKQGETQHIVSGTRKSLYTLEKTCTKPKILEKYKTKKSAIALYDERFSKNNTTLTYEKREERLSTPSLLSGYSGHMNASEASGTDQLMEHKKENHPRDHKVLENEKFRLPLENTNQGNISENNDVFEKNYKPPDSFYEEIEPPSSISSALSNSKIVCSKKRDNVCESHQNYNYQPDAHTIYENSISSQHIPITSNSAIEEVGNSIRTVMNHSNAKENHYDKSETVDVKPHLVKTKNASGRLGSFSILLEPIFILISVSNAINGSSFLCLLTIIVDFSRDIHIETSNEKYILMILSVGDLIGRLGFGWVTDHGHMSRQTFVATCFAFQGLFTAAIAWSSNFTSLAALVALYGLAHSGLVVIPPVIIAEYIDQDKQSIAIPSYHFLEGLVSLSISPLIGYFRDEVGAYDWMFYGIGILSALSCLTWIFASCILKHRIKS